MVLTSYLSMYPPLWPSVDQMIGFSVSHWFYLAIGSSPWQLHCLVKLCWNSLLQFSKVQVVYSVCKDATSNIYSWRYSGRNRLETLWPRVCPMSEIRLCHPGQSWAAWTAWSCCRPMALRLSISHLLKRQVKVTESSNLPWRNKSMTTLVVVL